MPIFRRTLKASREEVLATLDETGAFVSSCALSGRAAYAVELAAEELLSNVAKYAGRDGEPATASLLVDVAPGSVRLELEDDGPPFDPASVPPPPPMSLDASPGGRGIHLVRSLSRSLGYRRERDRNVLVVEIDPS